ncbi:flagellar hook capping FlgD N-terminal domain-containing protein [Paracoccus sp. JM45]|uniref:flagellar hook capping FlgD N-terminal domain-containing protein n=1 Tax=Paracoccus sp. JM45 TaxID=2283626 RepID=UPI000E6D31D7|nr:flagellar hook capping FlgD N-terminal domain-containing protein [Paracoccus sp. JM45]RJE80896.1 flagellar basal body rod modification protein [Paracoccus sp. JM45]
MVDAISAATTTQTTAATASSFSTATGADFQTFLTMLTAQLKNQDPLNPMEGTDFAIQLATFAGVEQQTLSNKYLEQMSGQGGTGGLGSMAAWIGKEARTTAPVFFGDDPLTLDIASHNLADSVQLITMNSRGQEIMREEIGPGLGQIDWYGRSADGSKLADGTYSFAVESARNGEVIEQTQVGVYARITEAQFGTDGARVIFQGGASAPADDITALRDPA